MNGMQMGAVFVAALPWTSIRARSVVPPRLAQATLSLSPLSAATLAESAASAMPWIEAWAYLPSRAKGASTLDIAHVLHASRAIQGARAAGRHLQGKTASVRDLVAAHAMVAANAPRGLRQVPAWFGAPGPDATRLLAPDAELVPDLVQDLFSFLARAHDCPITVSLVCHAQIGLIHPFCDGNGRMARLLGRWMLRSSLNAALAFDYYCTQVRSDPSRFGEAAASMMLGDLEPLRRLWSTACAQLPAAANAIGVALDVAAAELRSEGLSALKAQRILHLAARSLMISTPDLQRSFGLGLAGARRDFASLRAAGWSELNDKGGDRYLVPMALLRAIDAAHLAPAALHG